ncbi:MAG TPA: penicillin acylase family protein [Terriglobales bacterium]
MASTGTTIHSRTRSRTVVAAGLGVLILALIAAVLWLYFNARSALPQLDGRLAVRGLSAPVTVARDGHGFPTISAANLDDLFFAQGFITAQDRLFQMDGMRRYAAGELSEVVGEGQLKHDRQQRILGMRQAAQKNLTMTTPEGREHLEAYARGVNAYIESHRNRLPIEFRILGYSPKPWLPEDSLVIAAYMVQDLSSTPRHALNRERILAKLGPELTADLYVNTSWRERPPTVSHAGLDVQAPGKNDDKDEDDDNDDKSDSSVVELPGRLIATPPTTLFPNEQFFSDDLRAIGSNNWVVSGAHTISGKPLLSNDMHLGHQMPNLWYAAHLRCGQFDVAGVTLPGYPYVIAGHNQRIAWGFTNLGPTVEDVYIESFGDDGQYLTPEGWKQPERRQEIIHIKGKPDVAFDVLLTRHGPIVSELARGETRKLALRWTLYDGIRSPFFAVDAAQNWGEFRNAFSQFDAPGQNVVYADVDGNIGYQATGKVPIRATGDGSLPEDGSTDAHEWIGYVPYDALPRVYNPASGIIASANSRITPDGYANSLSTEWEAPWRVSRIYKVLESGKRFSASDMLALQTDVYSELDRFVAERIVYAVDHAKSPSSKARTAADVLRQWDGHMNASSAAPTIAVRSREELHRLLLESKLGKAGQENASDEEPSATLSWKSYQWMMSTVWLDNILQKQPQRWLPDGYSSYDDLLAAAVDAAVSDLDAPADLNSWNWGSQNPIEIQNPVLGKIPLLNRWTGTGALPQSGSMFTVKAVTGRTGPSERITEDLSNLDQSTLNLVTGEAGNFLSPYYMDEWSAWYTGFTYLWRFSKPVEQASGKHELTLEPAN